MKSRADALAEIAAIIQRLGVLLGAGVTPASAWGYLGGSGVPASVTRLVAAGAPIPDAILESSAAAASGERQLWGAVAAAWSVAATAGAPLAATLLELSGSIRDLAQSQRDLAIAVASPTATARLVLVLPGVGLVFGGLLGFNTLGTLVTTPVGWCCLGGGGGLLLLASRWNRHMLRSAQPRRQTPGLELDLLAIAVSGGGAIERARATVSDALGRYLGEWPETEPAIEDVLELSRRAGVPAAGLLRSEATELRRTIRAEVAERAQALSVRLMIPLGVCVLPAFMLLSVVPLIITVFAATRLKV